MFGYIGKIIDLIKKDGFKVAWQKFQKKLLYFRSFSIYMKKHMPSDDELARQREAPEYDEISFSIIVPMHNTPIEFLKEMIESVINQTYSRWQLCLADGSDPENKEA